MSPSTSHPHLHLYLHLNQRQSSTSINQLLYFVIMFKMLYPFITWFLFNKWYMKNYPYFVIHLFHTFTSTQSLVFNHIIINIMYIFTSFVYGSNACISWFNIGFYTFYYFTKVHFCCVGMQTVQCYYHAYARIICG